MSNEPQRVRKIFAALEHLVDGGDAEDLAQVPAINLHVVEASPALWSFVGTRRPRFAEGFAAEAHTLITCNEAGLVDLLKDPRDAREDAVLEIAGDRDALRALAHAIG